MKADLMFDASFVLKPAIAGLTLALLAGCALSPARPETVTLDQRLLTVTMSNGETCLGPAPDGAAASGWAGRLQGCSVTYPYEVRIEPTVNPLRMVMEQIFDALNVNSTLAPMARVTIIGDAGTQYDFVSPPDERGNPDQENRN